MNGVNQRRRRAIVIAALVVLIALVALVIAIDITAHPSASSRTSSSGESAPFVEGDGDSTSPPRSARTSTMEDYDGGPIARTIADRRVRDELRRRILAGWAQGEGETAVAAKEGRMLPPPMPTGADGRIDPQYIKQVAREDLMPMLKKCYEELTVRKPGAAGRISMTFKIVGDAKLGAIVDETNLAEDAGALADDDRFTTCARESTMSLAFRPLPFDGSAVVPITIVFDNNSHDH